MTVEFYYNPDDPATLDKTLTFITSADCEIKESSTILNPTLIIKYGTWGNLISNNCNYCKISNFGNRYYFLGNPVITTGGRVEIEANVDVLQSNLTELKECTGYVQRIGSTTKWNNYLPDSSVPVETFESVTNIQFNDSPFNIVDIADVNANQTQNYLLTVVGGGV